MSQVPSWLLQVIPQPYHTGNVRWRSQSSVPGGLGRSFHLDPQRWAEVQRTAGWQRPTPELWIRNQPGYGTAEKSENKSKDIVPRCFFFLTRQHCWVCIYSATLPSNGMIWNAPKWRPQSITKTTFVRDLLVECYSSVHVGAFLHIVTRRFHHILWVTEQSQVHQLVIQTILLFRHNTYFNNSLWEQLKHISNNEHWRFVWMSEGIRADFC